MSVESPAMPIEAPERSSSDLSPSDGLGLSSSSRSSSSAGKPSQVAERFYERYHSLKANRDVPQGVPEIDLEEIRSIFEFFDETGDGFISKDDLKHFMGRLGLSTTEEEISSMVSSVDVNGDGSVDFNEFASLYQTFAKDGISTGNGEGEEENDDDHEDDLKEAFRVFDKNADGFISPTELQEVLMNLGIAEGGDLKKCTRMIEKVADGNKEVNLDEFKKMMQGEFNKSKRS